MQTTTDNRFDDGIVEQSIYELKAAHIQRLQQLSLTIARELKKHPPCAYWSAKRKRQRKEAKKANENKS